MQLTKYGILLEDGALLGMEVTKGISGGCSEWSCCIAEIDYELETGYPPLLLDDKDTAESFAASKGDWCSFSPYNRYVGKCRAVRITLTIEE